MVLAFILIVLAVVIIVSKKRAAVKKKEQEEKVQKAKENYIVAKNKMRENPVMQMAIATTVSHIEELRKKADGKILPKDTQDFFVGTITRKYINFSCGLKKGERPHVSASEDFHYDKYSIWLHGLDFVFSINFEDKGYEMRSAYELELFLEVFAEELEKAGCPTWDEEYNKGDHVGFDTLLIWNITKYHPKKELQSFIS